MVGGRLDPCDPLTAQPIAPPRRPVLDAVYLGWQALWGSVLQG